MTPENFCYWLQGWFELNQTIDHREGATPETVDMIKDHLALVFDKVTPDRTKEVTRDVPEPIEISDALKEAIDNMNKINDKGPFGMPQAPEYTLTDYDGTGHNPWKWPPTVIC